MTSSAWRQRLNAMWRAERLSPKELVRRAVILLVLFGIAHAMGLRDHTAVLSGSRADPSLSLSVEAALGSTYLVLYLLVIVVVPILLTAAALAQLLTRLATNKGSRGNARPASPQGLA